MKGRLPQVTQLLGVLHEQEVFWHYFTSSVLGMELGTSGSLALCPLSYQERKPPAWYPPLVSSRTPQVPFIKAHTGTTKNWDPKRPHNNCFHEEFKNKKNHTAFCHHYPGLSIFVGTRQPTIQEQCRSTTQTPGSLLIHIHAF